MEITICGIIQGRFRLQVSMHRISVRQGIQPGDDSSTSQFAYYQGENYAQNWHNCDPTALPSDGEANLIWAVSVATCRTLEYS